MPRSDSVPADHVHEARDGVTYDTSPPHGYNLCSCGSHQLWEEAPNGKVVTHEWQIPQSVPVNHWEQ